MRRHDTHTVTGLQALSEELRIIRGVLWSVSELAALIVRATVEHESTGESETCAHLAVNHAGVIELMKVASDHADTHAELIDDALRDSIAAKGAARD